MVVLPELLALIVAVPCPPYVAEPETELPATSAVNDSGCMPLKSARTWPLGLIVTVAPLPPEMLPLAAALEAWPLTWVVRQVPTMQPEAVPLTVGSGAAELVVPVVGSAAPGSVPAHPPTARPSPARVRTATVGTRMIPPHGK
ncbi:hypothetical protein GCM10023170_002060 [Phytohabitans houttuyneae]